MFSESDYKPPCDHCEYQNCSFCEYSYLLNKKIPKLQEELSHANFTIDNELKPRLVEENRSYDLWATTDRACEWCEVFDIKVNELINMFDEDFDFSQFNFDDDDITSKIGKLIYEEKLMKGKNKNE